MSVVNPATTKPAVAEARSIQSMVDEAANLLPEQAPLQAFVHHNTLHAFEHLPFEEAVVEAGKTLGTEPFMSERAFAEHLRKGRIRSVDIEAVVRDEMNGFPRAVFSGAPNQYLFRVSRLQNFVEVPDAHALQFLLGESDVATQLAPAVTAERRAEIYEDIASHLIQTRRGQSPESEFMQKLWQTLEKATPNDSSTERPMPRPRDQFFALTGIDTDETVHPLLIRLSAAFLDQGVAYWSMPQREAGFLGVVRALYCRRTPPPDHLLRGLAEVLDHQQRQELSAEDTVIWALESMGIPKDSWSSCIKDTLLSLRGWAGMMRHLELRPDRAPVFDPGSQLIDYLAVQLTFDLVVARNALKAHFGQTETDIFDVLGRKSCDTKGSESVRLPPGGKDIGLIYESYILAQLLPVEVSSLIELEAAQAWVNEVGQFDELERRRLLHLAYERQHRVEVLDGLSVHCRLGTKEYPTPKFQATFCIDDREESLRRHLEEVFPAVDTYGYAGFYGVAMDYQGLDDVRSRPLCPVTVRPSHLVVERAQNGEEEATYRRSRLQQGKLSHAMSVASMTMTRGSLVSMVVGALSVLPLVLRSIFPRAANAVGKTFTRRGPPRPATRLQLERCEGEKDTGPYSLQEMCDIVQGALNTMGLTDGFSPIVLIVGHGSSSLNNPHEAAHDCGATGGGRGGPNARAFAAMANHPTVRQMLQAMGITIPQSTWLVGAYHNTCDDSMAYYDEDLIPQSHTLPFAEVKQAMAESCVLDAHERCRRFETAPRSLSGRGALEQAKIHADDLAEPRPEYGHATNAVCIVGRRQRTRDLFLDRRAFLVSYDPCSDPDLKILTALLMSVGPVGAGINLEYYFSFIDPKGYGSGTKLPHNITGLVGVMDGHATDLRTGLPWQMVEIHEPVRLLNIVEAKPDDLQKILDQEPALFQLVANRWIQLVAWDPDSDQMHVFEGGRFEPYRPETQRIAIAKCSQDYYQVASGHLPPAHISHTMGALR